MKLVLFMFMCSATAQQCMPPYEAAILNSHYDCMVRGYNESIRQLEKIGVEEVNKNKIYFRWKRSIVKIFSFSNFNKVSSF